jgi:hypothetical protein
MGEEYGSMWNEPHRNRFGMEIIHAHSPADVSSKTVGFDMGFGGHERGAASGTEIERAEDGS